MSEQASQEFKLIYEGKQPEKEILEKTPKAELSQQIVYKASETRWSNRLIYGDNLSILKTLLDNPSVAGKVKLIYIDPPFSTNQTFKGKKYQLAYEDTLSGSAYLEFLRKRLILLRQLLSEDGSIYVHLDSNMAFAIKVIMDEIFGSSNFRNWITRKKSNRKNYTRKTYGNMQDFILFYTKTEKYIWNRPYQERGIYNFEERFPRIEEESGRRYALVPIHAPGVRNGDTGKPWRGMLPPEGKHWMYTPEKLDEFDAKGEIYWSPTGNPRRKIFADQALGVPVQDIWLEFKDAHNQNIAVTGYPTEKNPDLLRRIIKTSSDEGDLVLDCFVGSGTTIAIAEELGRKWIGIDNSKLAVYISLKRILSKDDEGFKREVSQAALPLLGGQDKKPEAPMASPFIVLSADETIPKAHKNNKPEIILDWRIDNKSRSLTIELKAFVCKAPNVHIKDRNKLDLIGMILVDRHHTSDAFRVDDVFLGAEVKKAKGKINLEFIEPRSKIGLIIYDIYGNAAQEIKEFPSTIDLAEEPFFGHA